MHLWTKRPRRAMSHHLGWFVEGTTILGKRKNIWNHSMFWIGEDFKNWNLWNWSWQHRWAWYSIISWEQSGITYHFYTRVCFLVPKFQTRHQMLLWSPGVLLCWLIFSHKMTSRHFRSKGFVPPKNLSKSYSPNKLPEFSETYEPYWTTGDLLAGLQDKHLLIQNWRLVYRWWEIHLELG